MRFGRHGLRDLRGAPIGRSRPGNCLCDPLASERAYAFVAVDAIQAENTLHATYSCRRSGARGCADDSAIHDYIEIFHNTRRRHSALGMLTPTEYESRYFQTHDAA